MKKGIENFPVFISFLLFLILTYVFSTLGFIVPKWLEKWPYTKGQFENIGLWEVCFKNYMHDDIYDKLFTDCFNLNHDAISELKSWIVKDWFQAFRIFYTISFLILMFSTFYVIAMSLNTVNKFKKRNGYILLGLMLIGWFCCLVSLGLFGHYTDKDINTDWMPNPHQLTLSWSFGCGCLSLLGYMICIGHLGYSFTSKHPLKLRWYCGIMKNDDDDTGDMELLKNEKGNANTKSSIYDPRGTSTIEDHESQIPSIISHNASRSQLTNKTPSQLISPVSAGPKQQHQPHGRYIQKPTHHGSNSELRNKQDHSIISPPASHMTAGSSQMSVPRSQMKPPSIEDYSTVIESKPMKKRFK